MTRQSASASEVNDQAAEWAIRVENRGEDPDVAAALDAWLAEDPRHAGALLRAQAALSYLDRARALGAPMAPVLARARRGPGLRTSRRAMIAAGAGAGVLALGLGSWRLWAAGQAYDTRLGEVRRVPLADGSLATLNTQSRLKVELEPRLRTVTLDRGEAWFKVAHAPDRPFVVAAGLVRVRAVGTAFAVRLRDGGAEVLVTEGVVETWVVGEEERKMRLAAGSKAFVSAADPIQPVEARDEIEHSLAWRDGQVALYGETLADAAAEFNRYNAKKVVIADPELASEKVVGQFRADDPEGFARAAASSLGASVKDDGQTLTLARPAR